MKMCLTWLLFLSLLIVGTSYKILVFGPSTSRSHMISNGRIADVLAQAGHNVTLLEPDFQSAWHTINNTKHARRMPVFGFSNALLEAVKTFSLAFAEESTWTSHKSIREFSKATNQHCDELLSRKDVLAQLKAEQYDAFISESLNGCGPGLAEYLDIKIKIWVSSCPLLDHMTWILGIPHTMAYLPAVGNVDFGNQPNFVQRVQNILEYISNIYAWGYYGHGEPLDAIFRKHFGDDFPKIASITRKSDVIFISTDELVDFPRPLPPNIVHIGGLGIRDTTEEVEGEFVKQMALGKEGVVFFSFGSNVNTAHLPKEVMPLILNIFSDFPTIHFIVKVDNGDEVSSRVAKTMANVYTTEWAPQPALLNHPRLRFMISHGGYNTIMEAARAGKPIITIPFFVDQFRNGRVLEKNGWGIPVSRLDLLAKGQKLRGAIYEMLNNKKYVENAARTSRMIKNKPFSPEERLVKWTEFAISSNGLKELQTPAGELSLFIYFNLDIILLFIAVSFIFIYALYQVVSSLRRYRHSSLTAKNKTE